MRISGFRIRNYKSFSDTGEVALAPGMNIVTGQNNAGKTALLQALELRNSYKEHLSELTLPAKNQAHYQRESSTDFKITVNGKDLGIFTDHLQSLQVPIPPDPRGGHHPLGIPYDGNYSSESSIRKIWDWLHSQAEITFSFVRKVQPNDLVKIEPVTIPSHNLFSVDGRPGVPPNYFLRNVSPQGDISFIFQHGSGTDLGSTLVDQFLARIYRFSAERFGLGEYTFGANSVLLPDARNLAEVLNSLQPNADYFKEYVDLVRFVLPQVKWISVEPRPSNTLQIKVWTVGKETLRDDLAMPLAECGTGLGQVLAILYVAFTSNTARVLLIDEPQSFLHPGAARNLIEALKKFPHHQYVITSHSASVISAADAGEILILRNSGSDSSISVTDTNDNELLKKFLEEIGTRLGDVFGMEQVIWVEGPTEAAIFPSILKRLKKLRPGTVVVSIRNTGDLESKDAERIFGIYNNLTSKASILPQTMTFLLDSELRTPAQQKEIETMSGGRAFFLPRRNIECYLLHAEAVTAVCNAIEGFSCDGNMLDVTRVEESMITLAKQGKYWPSSKTPNSPNLDSPLIDGARLLSDLFSELSETRVRYRKTVHSVALYDWLSKHKGASVDEIDAFLNAHTS
ncbi:ATP-dependent nuclease [Terriglobus sp. ADX1]|uniref:ATP-dependent nuclease n=1 Tax=Terriglobus sp. ADX1 TaxID=2794063 RepID=UPI002FE50B77